MFEVEHSSALLSVDFFPARIDVLTLLCDRCADESDKGTASRPVDIFLFGEPAIRVPAPCYISVFREQHE